jgi:hypothetical protein
MWPIASSQNTPQWISTIALQLTYVKPSGNFLIARSPLIRASAFAIHFLLHEARLNCAECTVRVEVLTAVVSDSEPFCL